AVRSPSLYENDAERVVRGVSPPSLFPPLILAEVGNERVDAEKILAYELGYRVKPHERLALDVALFYNRYDDQIALQYGPIFVERDPEPAHNVFALVVDNRMEAETWGVEVDLRWKVTAWWKLQFAYTHMLIDADEESFTYPPFGSDSEESYPRDQFSVRSTMDLPEGFELDLGLRYVDDLEQGVDTYFELDLRLGWQLNDKLEIALVGRNLLDRQHPEFIISRPGGYGEVDRSMFGRITWRF
ncbi:MAG: TonB-dependent receptor, partial [Deltaproteobacteria bacterium]|nr:TonB-dependent receptor [Deltaproteobacteria bacterium]